MKKLFLIISILLLSATTSFAGGLFSGCMGSGFGTHITKVCSNEYPEVCRADTQAYITRVEADGGTVIDVAMVDAAYQLLDDYTLAPIVWVGANFGVKKDGSNLVSKLYDLSDNDHDHVQATAANQPFWNDDQQNGLAAIQFNGTDEWLEGGTQLGKPANFTAFTVFQTSNNTSQSALWMNRGGSGDYTWWGATMRYNSNGDMGLMVSKEDSPAGYIGARTGTGLIGTTDYYLRTDRYAHGGNVSYIYLDAGSAESLTYADQGCSENSGTSFDFRIGTYGNGGVSYFSGYISELVIFDASLSDTNRGYVRDFLNGEYELWE